MNNKREREKLKCFSDVTQPYEVVIQNNERGRETERETESIFQQVVVVVGVTKVAVSNQMSPLSVS